MKFCSLVFELHLPQNFCHTHTQTYRHTDTQTHRQTNIFQKQSNRVQDIPKRVNPSKTGNRQVARNQYFLLLTQKKVIINTKDLFEISIFSTIKKIIMKILNIMKLRHYIYYEKIKRCWKNSFFKRQKFFFDSNLIIVM